MKERGIIDPFALVLLVILALESLAVIHYCKPPVAFTWADGCVPIQPLPPQGDSEKE